MRQIDSMRTRNTRCIKNITACVTQSLKTFELDQSVCTLLLTNVKIFLQNDKKSIFEGSGVGAKNSSKTWSKCHFLLLYRRKSGQKVGKTQSFNRDFLVFQKHPGERLLCGFLLKNHRASIFIIIDAHVCTHCGSNNAQRNLFVVCVDMSFMILKIDKDLYNFCAHKSCRHSRSRSPARVRWNHRVQVRACNQISSTRCVDP